MEVLGKITLEAEHITTFHSFDEWVNKASSRIGGFSREQKIICIDINGNTLTNGGDFMLARDNNLFPVKAYRLVRTSEKFKKS
jgi:hypothetical protein